LGFGVVADEVRSLAQRSAQAARDTAAKIDDSIHKSQRGVELSSQMAHALEGVLDRVCRVDELIGKIAIASAEQSHGISQISSELAQMDGVTKKNASSAEESASAADELNAQAKALKEVVVELAKIVGGSKVVSHGEASPHETIDPTEDNDADENPPHSWERTHLQGTHRSLAKASAEAVE
jgi:methyl-accepting chemotaxis protein